MVMASELMSCLPPKAFMGPVSQHHTVDIDTSNTTQAEDWKRGSGEKSEAESADADTQSVDKSQSDVSLRDNWWTFWRPHMSDDPPDDEAAHPKEPAAEAHSNTKRDSDTKRDSNTKRDSDRPTKPDSEMIEMDATNSTEIPLNDSEETTNLSTLSPPASPSIGFKIKNLFKDRNKVKPEDTESDKGKDTVSTDADKV
jgi:hypothetical protein